MTKQRLISATHFEWKEVDCQPEADNAPPVRLGANDPPPINVAPLASSRSSVSATTQYTYREGALARGGDFRTLALQEALKKRGYYSGPLSGRFTSAVQLAMVRFQRDKGLSRGLFDHATAEALGLDDHSRDIPVGS